MTWQVRGGPAAWLVRVSGLDEEPRRGDGIEPGVSTPGADIPDFRAPEGRRRTAAQRAFPRLGFPAGSSPFPSATACSEGSQ